MPVNLKDLLSRIKSVKSTQKITKAMKLVSAAKFAKAQTNILNARPYALALTKLVAKVANVSHGACLHPLLAQPNTKKALVVIVSSERGLCGGYNANITRQAFNTIQELEQSGWHPNILGIGKKSFQAFLRRRRLFSNNKTQAAYISEKDFSENPTELLSGDGLALISSTYDNPSYYQAEKLADALAKLYVEEKIGKLIFVYNKFQSAMVQMPAREELLPLSLSTEDICTEPMFEPPVEELFVNLLPKYISSKIFQILLDANASEHGARMAAMDNATRNGQEMEQKLKIVYQRGRQAAITNELIEIISGAEAL